MLQLCNECIFDEEDDVEDRDDERDEVRDDDGAGVGERMILLSSEGERVREDVSRYACIAGARGECVMDTCRACL